MKQGQKIDLGMTGYDELFMNDEQRKENRLAKIQDVPISEIDDFPDHPFQVRFDEDMEQLVESIKERGLITPIILRKKDDGRYEVVSGHRRKQACKLAGMDTIKAEIREMSRDEAIIMMVDANLQRTEILPSEKAKAYKMRLDAMKRQGARTDLTSVPVAQKSKTSRQILGEAVGESPDQIRRYIRLNELVPEILEKVDEGKIGMRPAVELSYLTKDEQNMLVDAMAYADATPSHDQALRLKAFSQDGVLGPHVIENIMNEEKPNQKAHISIRYEDAKKYIPSSVPMSRMNDYILKVLEQHYREQERNRDNFER